MKKFLFLINCLVVVSILNIENAYCQSGAKWSSNGNYFSNPNAKPVFGTLDSNDVIIISAGIERSRYTTDGIFQINNGTNLEITGDIISHLFSGSTGLVSYDINGKFHWVPYGNPNSVLFGNGTWGILPPDDDWLQITGSDNIYTFPNRWVGIGIEPTVPLDVLGNVWFRGNLKVDSDADFGGKVTADIIQASTVNGTNGSLDFNGSSITNISSINAGSISADNLNVSYTSFDSLNVQNRIKVGSTITIEGYPSGPSNKIYTDNIGDNRLFIQSEPSPFDFHTIINANNNGFVGIGTAEPEEKLHISNGNILLDSDNYLKSKRDGHITNLIGVHKGSTPVGSIIEIGEPTTFPREVRIYTPSDPGNGVSIHNGIDVIAFFQKEGRVGIGTIYPGFNYITPSSLKLDVLGDGRFGGTHNYVRLGFKEDNSIIDSYGEGKLLINYHSGKEVHIGTGTTKADVYMGKDLCVYGNVGIGTTSPASSLDILTPSTDVVQERLLRTTIDDAAGDFFEIRNSTFETGQYIPTLWGHHQTNTRQALFLLGEITDETDIGVNPVITFDARQEGAEVQNRPLFSWASWGNTKMTMSADGNLGIGTTDIPTGFKLAVCGKIKAKELELDFSKWCDYVFEEGYKRMTWKEKELFYKKYNHLPYIAPGWQIVEEGLEMGETIRGVTKNVEENRLDITDLFKRVEKLEKSNAEKDKEIEILKKEKVALSKLIDELKVK